MNMRRILAIAFVLASAVCLAQRAPTKDQPDPRQPAGPQANQAPPRSQTAGPGDSSSRDTSLGVSPDTATPDDSVSELHSWDPHKAQQDVEIGTFYFKRQNYHAALSRYCEALTYKPNDAIATFRIAESLEKFGDLGGAGTYYEGYLKILPDGPFAAQSKKALDRIKAQAEHPNKHVAEHHGCEPLGKAARFRPEPFDPDRPVLTRDPTTSPSEKSH